MCFRLQVPGHEIREDIDSREVIGYEEMRHLRKLP